MTEQELKAWAWAMGHTMKTADECYDRRNQCKRGAMPLLTCNMELEGFLTTTDGTANGESDGESDVGEDGGELQGAPGGSLSKPSDCPHATCGPICTQPNHPRAGEPCKHMLCNGQVECAWRGLKTQREARALDVEFASLKRKLCNVQWHEHAEAPRLTRARLSKPKNHLSHI